MSQKKNAKTAKKSGKTKKGQKNFSLGNKVIVGILTIAVLVTGFTLLNLFPLRDVKKRPSSTASSVSSQEISANSIKENIKYDKQKKRVYEENERTGFLSKVRKVDRALLKNLFSLGVDPEKVRHREMKLKEHLDSPYYRQTLVLELQDKLQKKFISEFRSYLHQKFDRVEVKRIEGQNPCFRVSIGKVTTHLLMLQSGPVHTTAQEETKPKISIVIDDMGENISKAQRLYDILGNSVSFSILPHSTYSRQVANLAAEKGISVLLHQPMEPKGYPEVDPGAGTLFLEMSKSRMKQVLASNLESIPGVIGVNNHMGSRFTSSKTAMRVVLKELKDKDLFFMDSLTSPESKGDALASSIGVQEVNRDIFLDNQQDEQAILFQLQKAARLAKKTGKVVAIGHPYPETLTALRKWTKQEGENFRLCSIAEIVNSKTALSENE